VLIAALVTAWSQPAVRTCLLGALASHGVMRLWSAFDFIPKALAFERAPPGTVSEAAARAWTARSRLRLPLVSRPAGPCCGRWSWQPGRPEGGFLID
jgi:hypothetical protein